jgi:hypothetical protein
MSLRKAVKETNKYRRKKFREKTGNLSKNNVEISAP